MNHTPEPKPPVHLAMPATIVRGANGKWCCSACGGFVRHDAPRCKYCHITFDYPHSDRYRNDGHPTTRTTLTTLIGALLLLILCGGGGFLVGAQFTDCGGFFPGLACAMNGGFIGLAIGSVLASLTLIVGLRST